MGRKNSNRPIETLPLERWEQEAVAWCDSRGVDFKVTSGGHHWQFRLGGWHADWWPASCKLHVNDRKFAASTLNAVLNVLTPLLPEPPTQEDPPFDTVDDQADRVEDPANVDLNFTDCTVTSTVTVEKAQEIHAKLGELLGITICAEARTGYETESVRLHAELTQTEAYRDELLASNGQFLAEIAQHKTANDNLRTGIGRRDDDIRDLARLLETARSHAEIPDTAGELHDAIFKLASVLSLSGEFREKFTDRFRKVLRCFEAGR